MNEYPVSQPNVEPAPPPQSVSLPSLVPTVTYAILGITIFVYVLQLVSTAVFGYAAGQADWLQVYGARINSAIRAGEYWRFITPVFLHGSVMHIFFNMYALFSIGSFLEQQFGHVRFAWLYFLGAFSGNVFSFLFTGEDGYSVGASTAIFGLIAAQGIFFYQNQKLFGRYSRQAISNSVFIIAINLFIGLSPGIDNWGHIGGLLGGAIFAWFASPKWEVVETTFGLKLQDNREFRETVLGAGLVIIIFGILAVQGIF